MSETWDFEEGELTIYMMEEGSPVLLFQPHELCDGDDVPWADMVSRTRVAAAAPELLAALTVVTEFAAACIEKLKITDTNGIIADSKAIISKARGQ